MSNFQQNLKKNGLAKLLTNFHKKYRHYEYSKLYN